MLRILTDRAEDGTLIVRLQGDLDIYSAGDLFTRLRRAEAGCTDIVIDLSDLQFLDCAGLKQLVEAGRRAEVRGGRLTLLDGSPAVQRILKLTGMESELAHLISRSA
ncbi:MAG TPA: STAS domain-containing protein [Actinomycetota bacterium]|nr:STAS domain-containing protein [Actinomycetota bacterium]